ncbi:uncharacterized protein LOC135082930 [Ostrinia nubilalis]|uniref:uncharacterized protein LOC135082930 n=1 Tax=Ostrinia nubilalis TaxID=29057 RepID=UPI00308245E0
MPETCKPYESTFSEGCPPADWCTGCTVCDCDANGRWDCHILSFCPDKKDKNKLKTSKKRLRDGSPPKRTTVTASKSVTPNNKNTKNHPKRTPTPTTPKKPAVNKKQVKNNGKILQKEKQNNGYTKQVRKWTPNATNTIEKRSSASPKPLIIKKEVPKTPILVNVPNLEGKNAEIFTQEVYKKVVLAVEKMLEKRIAAVPKPTKSTGTRSRKMVKRSTKNLKNIKNAKKKVDGQFRPVPTNRKYTKPIRPKNNKKNVKRKSPVKSNKKVGNGKRIKRDISENNTTEKLVIEYSTFNNTDFTVTILPNATSSGVEETVTNVTGTNNYYKYSMITPSLSTATVNSEEYQIVYASEKNKTTDFNRTHTHQKRDKEKHFDEIQAEVLNNNTNIIKNNTVSEKPKFSLENVSSDLNDLKFKEWSQIKLLKHRIMSAKQVGINATVSGNKTSNFSKVYEDSGVNQPKVKAKDIARIVSPTTRKYNRSKVINTSRCNTANSKKRSPESFRERFYHKIDDLQNVLKRLLSEFHKTNKTNIKPKPRRFSVIKYLKRFFTKTFKKYKGKGKNGSKYQNELNDHIVNTICESFSDCDMSQKNNIKLRNKLRELNNESYVIIRTIKIIKGLLHLLDVPSENIIDGDKKLNSPKDNSNFKEDIHKLNSVLKDKYINNNTPLTSTQMTQIKYIKNNTQLFVQSVSRFANILNEIITILTKKQNIEDKSKQSFKTAKRSYDNIRKLKNDTDGDFKRLKGLLVKYNLIQNTFVRKMYNLLTRFEKVQENSTKPKMNKENKLTTATIERFSRNIINNLRKLKNLAKMLNSRRKKRNAMRDDDAMEYLLTLMEYLLKQNYPLDAAPVNDGIDLLIEAIKSAPDIKPIKKKVLQLPVNIRISRTTEPIPYGMSKMDTYSDSRKASDDSAYNDTVSDTREHSSNQEKDSEDFKYQPGKNIFDSGAAGNTEVYYEKGEPSATPKKLMDTTVPGSFGIFGNVDETTEYNKFKKLESIAKESNKKFELFNSDLDDDEVEVSSTTVVSNAETEMDNAVTVTIPLETTEGNADDRSKQYNINSADVSGNSAGDKRVVLDWLDDGYEDNKEVRQTKNVTVAQTVAPVITTTKAVHVDNVSTLTKEASDEEEKKRMMKINVHDVMFKKQMDLLNSLDYGTERSEADDTESKEGDERYSGDVFPSYFA